ncbi:hypothetical protein L1987_63003 [Smallanthus sonchifolius]|uniref:Uncharacterized protein n=1 Tax=Smallanthus sonchifolius TaxID=185202 RepID=A0ACB9CBZ7_9ASTR|nr:hypothetical protein L1987_63003 [Smallanthus sonchifolius]
MPTIRLGDSSSATVLVRQKKVAKESIYSFFDIWANKKSVRQALHIRKGTVDKIQYRNMTIDTSSGKPDTIYYSHDIVSSLSYYKQLVTKDCHALIINGDHDMTFPYVGTKQWINSLNLKVKSPWKPWFIRTQVVGYEKTYSKAKYSLKYATIKEYALVKKTHNTYESREQITRYNNNNKTTVKI